ncbi:MAG TPA: NUDIX domain-containing protein [Candidatus Saccharimonadales bacterium]|nr:NUDIX domain-containing protein [Candidatus Saccharimonadales bacterium]
MHHIQRKILAKLLYASSLPYAAIRPEGVESNHFAYHLEQLIAAKLIQKTGKQYSLTPEGLSAVDRMSHEKVGMVGRLQPHILTVIDITNSAGETLLFKRNFQPYIHLVGFPMGKVHYEEDLNTSAERELLEKTGLTGIPLTQRGVVYVESRQQGHTISKILCHVFQGSAETAPPLVTHRGATLWAKAGTFKRNELMPGFTEIKALLQKNDGFFFDEITADLS